jgi:hypothetical protein
VLILENVFKMFYTTTGLEKHRAREVGIYIEDF